MILNVHMGGMILDLISGEFLCLLMESYKEDLVLLLELLIHSEVLASVEGSFVSVYYSHPSDLIEGKTD